MINDILDFSKIEAGKLELESIDFDLREQPGTTPSRPLALRAQQKGLELACHMLTRGAGALFVGDPGRLRQILVNLVGNAIKFTDARRSECPDRRSHPNRQNQISACLHFAVQRHRHRDPAGEASDHLRGVRPGGQLHDAQYGGTGLGLTISRAW